MTFIEMREAAAIACATSAVKMLPDCPEKDACNAALVSLWAALPGSLRDALQSGELPKEVWE
ncbi:hypothetical protein [Olsenella sp. HMSC062G07]|uniref:hypothetical protein n=1 Tax=Olsenella sp. HMSC062G07 TaxID=1739330 RepID=UPI0008A44035|nr:hypothetical protein [Olsenella sp. HMSC062G07]OFK25057.1 hypothetical protein HMPREF2826_00275 [Olsenella sp. HMSC062G07]